MEPRRSPRRVPSQERSRKLVNAVREAGVQILSEEGAEALTTTRIAQRAGVSVGSLYQYFENREAVLEAIYQEKISHDVGVARRWMKSLRNLSPRERAAQSIRWAFDQHRERLRLDPDYYRTHHWAFSVTPRLADGNGEDSSATAFARKLLQDAAGFLRRIDIDHAAVILGQGVPALLRGVLVDRPELIQDDGFRESVVDFVCTWLYGPDSDEGDPPKDSG